jgi:uncharacterized delta-60 repeat protein
MMNIRAAKIAGLLLFSLFATMLLVRLTDIAHASTQTPVAPAADSDLDPTFGNAGVVTMNVPGLFIRVVALPNGKVLALLAQADDPDAYEYGKTTGKLVRFNEDGSLDMAFGINGMVEPPSVDPTTCLQNNAGFTDFAMQPDGKILAWYECSIFVRLLPNGAADLSFGQQGKIKADGYSRWLATAPDGKLYLGWLGSPYGGWSLTRFFSNGALDAGFGMTGTIHSESPFFINAFVYGASLWGIVPSQDGGITLGHSAYTAWPSGSTSACYIDVYAANGQNRNRLPSPDNLCFHGIIDGYSRMSTYGPCMTCTTRLKADGTVDTSFGFSGTISSTLGLNPQPRQTDGKYFCLPTATTFFVRACGGNWPEANDQDLLLARLNELGQRDSSFGGNGIARFVFTYTLRNSIPPTVISDSQARDVALELDGRIVLAGRYRANVLPCPMPPNCDFKLRYFPVLLRLNGARVPIEKRYLPAISH